MNLENASKRVIEVIELARRDVFGGYLEQRRDISPEFKDGGEPVTELDRVSSTFLISQLDKAFPGIEAVSEESPPEAFHQIPDRFWLIDPLDGTVNFIRGIPYCAISISLVESGKPVLGVTQNLLNGDTYYAYSGGGVYKNGWRIQRIGHENNKILSTGFPHARTLHAQHLSNLKSVFPYFSDIRRFASPCLDLCLLCEGCFDCVFEILKSWDFYAGQVTAKEVGLNMYITPSNKPLNQDVYFICGEEALVDRIREEADLLIRK